MGSYVRTRCHTPFSAHQAQDSRESSQKSLLGSAIASTSAHLASAGSVHDHHFSFMGDGDEWKHMRRMRRAAGEGEYSKGIACRWGPHEDGKAGGKPRTGVSF